jgi:ABC-2 type transport system permease protein
VNPRKYFAIAKTAIKSNLAYAGEVAGRTCFLFIVLYIFLKLWEATYHNSGSTTMAGLTLAQMLWYMTLTESIVLSGPRMAPEVDQDVRTGSLAIQLVRPLSYPLYRMATYLGERSVRFVTTFGVGIVLAYLIVGPLSVSPQAVLYVVPAVSLAFVLDFIGNLLVGLGAFWMEDTSGLTLLYSRATMVLGGMLIPMQMFPEQIQPILLSLPFPYILYGPARLLVSPNAGDALNIVAHQLLWIAVGSAFLAFVYSRAMKRVFSNGG